jgi:TetR/AcrR family transcriptional regulator
MSRAEQRESTRRRIVEAAVVAFSEEGYRASSTRDIAARAGVTQGLVTYHFESKDELWRAAADRIFGQLVGEMPDRSNLDPHDRREAAREAIRAYVRSAARHPELLQFMVDAGKHADDRMRWLVETHVAPRFADVARFSTEVFGGADPELAAHIYYALAGAASLIFANASECRQLTGMDPRAPGPVERHAELVARMFVPG